MNRKIRVGVADSGINPNHRHVGEVAGGVGVVVTDGRVATDDDWLDQLGHGTAVAATIRGHAPAVELYSIRIFRRRLEAQVDALLFALEWAASNELDLLNLSLGCADEDRRDAFVSAVADASSAGVVVIAAHELSGKPSLPGSLPGVIAVGADPELGSGQLRFEDDVIVSSSWARQLGELPKERNFHGVSLAVAHVTGVAAGLLSRGVSLGDRRR